VSSCLRLSGRLGDRFPLQRANRRPPTPRPISVRVTAEQLECQNPVAGVAASGAGADATKRIDIRCCLVVTNGIPEGRRCGEKRRGGARKKATCCAGVSGVEARAAGFHTSRERVKMGRRGKRTGVRVPRRRPAGPAGREPIGSAVRVPRWSPPLPCCGRPAAACIPGSRAQRPGSRSDISPTAKLSPEWPTQDHLARRGWRLYPGGRVVPVSRKSGTQQSSASSPCGSYRWLVGRAYRHFRIGCQEQVSRSAYRAGPASATFRTVPPGTGYSGRDPGLLR
jgi:hypothetical protein